MTPQHKGVQKEPKERETATINGRTTRDDIGGPSRKCYYKVALTTAGQSYYTPTLLADF
jgi:hypothetical protein